MKSGFLNTGNSRTSLLSEISESKPGEKYKLDDFDLERRIGTGNFSNIWFASLKCDPEKYFALKIFDRKQVEKLKVQECLVQERRNMAKLMDPGHPNIIKFEGSFKDDKNLYILYEMADTGELWNFMKLTGIPYEKLAANLILQLVNSLEYIHSKNIVHRDIKCENLVISRDGQLKLIDFGSSVDLDYPIPTVNGTQHCVGTPRFMAPESVQNGNSGKLRDLWSLGCTIYQILTGHPPFFGSTDYFVYNRILSGELKIPNCLSEAARDLIKKLIVLEPQNRLGAINGFSEIKNHKFFECTKSCNFVERSKNHVSAYEDQDFMFDSTFVIDKNWGEFKNVCRRFSETLIKIQDYESQDDFNKSKELELELECIIKETECGFSDCGKLKCRIHGKGELLHFHLSDWKAQREKEMIEANKWLK
ncbi:Protein kinase domain [Babesia microti strain RI]|uniref:Protein kinase domain n=1 Tax=Babesia microti (strain RI) TaxID=1133968 RepID=A0A1N6LY22_BABMR|nr:Protein kinase domain [Babesia microti strain RI]SIO73780.1 Protein kinase domain [Babesia microti strain RI]|eukprot:XP_021337841.1 Protein kinase domain [Babesia microti strain RI]